MAGDTVIIIVGDLTADPELRFTPRGAAVANFTIASTPPQLRPAVERGSSPPQNGNYAGANVGLHCGSLPTATSESTTPDRGDRPYASTAPRLPLIGEECAFPP